MSSSDRQRAIDWVEQHLSATDEDGQGLRRGMNELGLGVMAMAEAFWTAFGRASERGSILEILEASDSVGSFEYAAHEPFVVDPDAPRLETSQTLLGDRLILRLGLGCMRLVSKPFEWKGEWKDALGLPYSPEENRHALLNAVRGCGIDYVDVARGYGPWPGAGEGLLLDWVGPFRRTGPDDDDAPLASTKAGYRRDDDGEWWVDLSAKSLAEDVQGCVADFGGFVPVLYVVAKSTPEVRVENRPASFGECLLPAIEAQARGQIGEIAVANVDLRELDEAVDQADRHRTTIAAVQNKFTLEALADPAERAVLERTRELAIPFVTWGIFGEDAWPRPEPSPVLRDSAEQLGVTHQELTIALLLAASTNTVILPGASRRETIYSSVRGANLEVPEAILARFDLGLRPGQGR